MLKAGLDAQQASYRGGRQHTELLHSHPLREQPDARPEPGSEANHPECGRAPRPPRCRCGGALLLRGSRSPHSGHHRGAHHNQATHLPPSPSAPRRWEGGEEPLSCLHFWSIFKTDVILIKIQGPELHGLRSLREGAARRRQSESATLAAEGLSLGLQTWQCPGSRAVLRLLWDVWILFLTIPRVRDGRGMSVCAEGWGQQ